MQEKWQGDGLIVVCVSLQRSKSADRVVGGAGGSKYAADGLGPSCGFELVIFGVSEVLLFWYRMMVSSSAVLERSTGERTCVK